MSVLAAARQHLARLDAPVRAGVLMIGACAGFSTMMAIVRLLAPEVPPLQTAFFRNLFGLMLMLPWLLRAGPASLRTGRPGMHLLRALTGLAAMLLLFTALGLLPLADVTAISFTAPVFATLGAALLLREQVGARRWLAAGVGLVGALVILRPGHETFTPAALVALAAAAGIAAAQLSVKALSRTEDPNAMVLIMMLLMTPLSLPPALFVWVWPSAEQFAWLLLMAAVATFGQSCLVRAMAAADASLVMPFDYARLVFAAGLGWLLFAELPDLWTVGGAAIIVASTVGLTRYERRRARQRRQLPPVEV